MKRTNIKALLQSCKAKPIYRVNSNTVYIGSLERHYISASIRTALIGCFLFALTLSLTLNIIR